MKKLEAMGFVYYFDFDDIEHKKEINEQLLAQKEKKCNIIWSVSLAKENNNER